MAIGNDKAGTGDVGCRDRVGGADAGIRQADIPGCGCGNVGRIVEMGVAMKEDKTE